MRRTIGLALLVLAAACSGGGTAPTGSTPAPPTTVATTQPTPTTAPGLPVPRASLLAAIVLFPGELPEPYAELPFDEIESGYRPAGADLAHALDPEDEADDIVRFGFLAELTTAYGGVDRLSIATEAVEFATVEGAGGYIADWVDDLARSSEDAAPGSIGLSEFTSSSIESLGEEAVRVDYVTTFRIADGDDRSVPGSAVAIRADRIVAWVWASGEGAPEAIDDLDDLVGARLTAAVAGSLAGRDPGLLDLADPPTAVLNSFTFEYRYGLEAAEGSFAVHIQGIFVAPDRTECRIESVAPGSEPTTSSVVATGTTVWIGGRTGHIETPLRDPAALSALASCPGHPLFWEITRFHRLPTSGAEPGVIRDIDVFAVDLAGDPEALASLGYLPEEASLFTRYEIAVAAEGGWLVELHTERETDLPTAMLSFGIPSADVHPGVPATVYDALIIGHPNDPALRVESPLPAG